MATFDNVVWFEILSPVRGRKPEMCLFFRVTMTSRSKY